MDYFGQTHSADKIIDSVVLSKAKHDRLHRDSWIPSINLKGITETS